VLLVDKAFFGRGGCSALASGVYKVYMPEDDMDVWLRTTCSTPLVNKRLAEKALLKTYQCLTEMDKWGVKWIKEGGKIVRVPSGGAGVSFPINAMMAEGGPQMMMALRGEALRQGVRVVNRVMATDLLTSDGKHPTRGKVVGAVGLNVRTAEPWLFRSKATIVSAGPYKFPYPPTGRWFQGMPINDSADGIAMMFRAGVLMGKFECGGGGARPSEFHSAPGLEMLGGLGCRFVNDRGEDIFTSGDRKGRYRHDEVIRGRRSALGYAMVRETREERQIFLDATHFTPEQHRLVKQVVPIVINTFERAGYDLSKDVVPYSPTLAASSGVSGGGARLNERCETSLPGLYGAGDCSDGAYQGMSLSLHGGSVTGAWAGENAAQYVEGRGLDPADRAQAEELIRQARYPLEFAKGISYGQSHEKLERLLVEVVGHVLNGKNLELALQTARAIKGEDLPRLSARDPHELGKINGLKNFTEMFEPALMVLLRRKESRGNILREDYPETDNIDWTKFTVFRKEIEGIKFWEEPIPEDEDHLPYEKTRMLHPFFK
jgi:succinate dehydrogenase/fumarate reductase flavoprotein subunit